MTLDGSDGHRDHVRVRDAVRALIAGDRHAAVPPVPAAIAHARLGPAPRRRRGQGGVRDAPRDRHARRGHDHAVDTADLLPRRRAAIALHRSQRSPFEGLPDDVQLRWLGREHLVRVNPPWAGGPPETDLVGL